MVAPNAEILDTVKLVFRDDYEPLSTEAIEEINAQDTGGDDQGSVLSGSIRAISTYDPRRGGELIAMEIVGLGKDNSNSELEPLECVVLCWPDTGESWAIDTSSGLVLDDDGEVVDLDKNPSVHTSLLGALALLVEETMDL